MTTNRAFSLDRHGKRQRLDIALIRFELPGGGCLELDLDNPSFAGIPLYAGHVPTGISAQGVPPQSLLVYPLASNMLAMGTYVGSGAVITPAQAYQTPAPTGICAFAVDPLGVARAIAADAILVETGDQSALHFPLEGLFGHLLLIHGRPDVNTEPDFAAWRQRHVRLQLAPSAVNLAIIGTQKTAPFPL